MKKIVLCLVIALIMCIGAEITQAETTVNVKGDFIYNISSTKKLGFIVISGLVTKSQNGQGLNIAYVSLYYTGELIRLESGEYVTEVNAAPTGGFGYYSFPPVFVGTFIIGCARKGYQTQFDILPSLVSDTTKDFSMVLN